MSSVDRSRFIRGGLGWLGMAAMPLLWAQPSSGTPPSRPGASSDPAGPSTGRGTASTDRATSPTPPADPASATAPAGTLQRRRVPSSGQLLPVVGCGTWQTFDVGDNAAARARLVEVLRVLFDAGGSVIDSSPMYGSSEEVAGAVLGPAGGRARAFVATKVWTSGREAGIAQMNRSMKLLGSDPIDLIQVHNLLDWRTHLATLRAWKQEGRVRHLGVTHYTASAYDELERVMRAEPLDFVQLNYAVNDRAAEARLLPLAVDRGIAVLVNRPFGGGGLLRSVREKPLPGWAADLGAASWPQLLLRFTLSHPAVTCVIPGTSRPEHMRDNVMAGMGRIPPRAAWSPHLAELER